MVVVCFFLLVANRGANIEAAKNVNNEINVVVVDIVACNKTHSFLLFFIFVVVVSLLYFLRMAGRPL